MMIGRTKRAGHPVSPFTLVSAVVACFALPSLLFFSHVTPHNTYPVVQIPRSRVFLLPVLDFLLISHSCNLSTLDFCFLRVSRANSWKGEHTCKKHYRKKRGGIRKNIPIGSFQDRPAESRTTVEKKAQATAERGCCEPVWCGKSDTHLPRSEGTHGSICEARSQRSWPDTDPQLCERREQRHHEINFISKRKQEAECEAVDRYQSKRESGQSQKAPEVYNNPPVRVRK
jgi:hypothetical protein